LTFSGKGTSFSGENIQGKTLQNALTESIDTRCQDYKGLISLDEISGKPQGDRLKISQVVEKCS
jgi:hypothetical protein